jgi:hypothetical protein
MGKRDSNYHDGSKNRECYFCGVGPPLNEHHIIPQRFDGPDTKENIVELCDLCHQKIERLYNKSFYEWFGIEDESGERKYHRQCGNSDCKNRAKVKVNSFKNIVPAGLVKSERGFRCRPCAAKLARKIAHKAKKEYKSEISEFYDDLDKIHKHARAEYKFGFHKSEGMTTAERMTRRLSKPQKPSAELILDEIVVEEADE